jgi:hypothetical protein
MERLPIMTPRERDDHPTRLRREALASVDEIVDLLEECRLTIRSFKATAPQALEDAYELSRSLDALCSFRSQHRLADAAKWNLFVTQNPELSEILTALIEAARNAKSTGWRKPTPFVKACKPIEPLAAKLRGVVGVNSISNKYDYIGKTQKFILIAANELKAFDRASAQPLRVIVKNAGYNDPDARNIENAVKGLKDRGLMDAVRGNNGGHWITKAGREIATAS